MNTAEQVLSFRSLAQVRSGESVEIREILFDSLRGLCHDLGLETGAVVHCRAAERAHLLLETSLAHVVMLERDWARFIQVVDHDCAPGRSWARRGNLTVTR